MLRSIVFIAFALTSFSSLAHAGLKQIIAQIDTATTFVTYERLAKESEQIVNQESGNWLAFYWCSFNYAAAAYVAPRERKDELLDRAQKMLDRASTIKKNEAEILLLQSWIYSTRVTVAPATRVKEFGPKANEVREQAYLLDPHNPRYYFLKGTSMYFMPPALGGGKSKAKPLFEQSIAQFKTYRIKGDLYPQWGAKQAEELLEACK